MVHNVNESLREPEVFNPDAKNANENTSYSSKIKNGINLNEVYSLIEKVKLEVFRGNEEGFEDFQEQKLEETGTFLDKRRRNK
jgi:hypothetical protein